MIITAAVPFGLILPEHMRGGLVTLSAFNDTLSNEAAYPVARIVETVHLDNSLIADFTFCVHLIRSCQSGVAASSGPNACQRWKHDARSRSNSVSAASWRSLTR